MKEVSLMKNNKKRCFLFAILGAAVGAVFCAKKKVGPFKNLGSKKDKAEKAEKSDEHDAK